MDRSDRFDLLRFDLHEAQLWLLGQRWSLGIDAFQRGELDATAVALSILFKAIVPGVLLVAGKKFIVFLVVGLIALVRKQDVVKSWY